MSANSPPSDQKEAQANGDQRQWWPSCTVQRAVHLLLAALLGVFLYSPFGLGSISEPVPASGQRETAAKRIGRTTADEMPQCVNNPAESDS